MEDAAKASKGSGPVSPNKQPQRKKEEVCNEFLKCLRESGDELVDSPSFCESIHAHFQRLPARYAQDVNVDHVDDVLTHKRLLELAQVKDGIPIFHVRAVHVRSNGLENLETSSPSQEEDISSSPGCISSRVHPPSFGSSANWEALALVELNKTAAVEDNKGSSGRGQCLTKFSYAPMHEVTFSTADKPKLLSKLSSLLADIGLNIQEAHIFSTVDGYSLDVFVVDGWRSEDAQGLQQVLEVAIAAQEKNYWSVVSPASSPPTTMLLAKTVDFLKIPSDGVDDWEIDHNQLNFKQKIASGSFGDLFRGTYCGQDVAIKVLKPERLNIDLQREFAQEVYIMRKVRHKNVVQFIGACTLPPNLCIVTEFMSGGSIYDYLHKHKGVFTLAKLLKVAIDVSKGMDYLHQCNIIHRDLKAANLLMDEREVVKVADFGVARVQAQSGVMTAETGTYRWMAPEVIEHLPYDCKADVFSFGIVLWELLTAKLPYDGLTPLQAAVGVVQKGLRPVIPQDSHPRLAELLPRCWQQIPSERLEFSEITTILQDILREVSEAEKGTDLLKSSFH
eukprot:c20659_g1_i1 orf=208-1893(-)